MTAALCPHCATPVPADSRFCSSCGHDVSGEQSGAARTIAVQDDVELLTKLQSELGDEYVIERELGRGGMAVVFLARDEHLGRKVAVKVLPPELTFGSAGAVERFKREARTAATLDHPHVIPIHRVSTGGRLCWYVMKYLEGESLDHVLEREPLLPLQRVAEIISQVADALDYAHEHEVVHRDIKPANVMLDGRGRVTVTDFGIAKALSAETLTASGAMIGTPNYMSPEQCTGKKAITGASDQYSLGIMAYQMLGGRVPFSGESVIDIAKQHCMDPVPPLGELRPDLSPTLVAVVERALEKRAEDRFPSVAAFAEALGRAIRGEAVALPPKRSGVETTIAVGQAKGIAGVLGRSPKRTSRRPLLVGSAIAGVVVAAALGVTQPWRSLLRTTSDPAGADTTARAAQQVGTVTAGVVDSGAARARADDSTGSSARRAPERQPTREAVAGAQTRREADTLAVRPAAPTTGFISVGARANAAITINGRSVSNPVSQYEVPAGRTTIVFTVTDSTGQWPWDTTVMVPAGQHLNLRYLRPVRR